ncbi:MAG: gamma-glutamyltransferase [Acidobacteriia bacterium]|jgi:gamma-glutamyltranspeptidase/glutathione hydrolase|nr:gamma-glutamyltransferase [Terriglobia bacterium]
MQSHCKLFILLLFILLTLGSGAPRSFGSSLVPVVAPRAMVASVNQLASRAGVQMMKSGGNAVDAAVAVGFVLAVVHPQAGNLGGGGFMLVRFADGTTHFIDYREKAPAAATANMYLDAQGNVIEDASTIGYKAIGVPGSVAGMVYAEKKYGKLSLARVMAPAIKLAEEGFALAAEDARDLQEDKQLGQFPESRRVFQREGNYYRTGEVFKQPDLARTLKHIAGHPDDFYHGDLARELAASVQKGGGLITVDDLAHYEVKERGAVRGSYRGYEIISAPPPSSGGTTLIEILNILEGYDLGAFGRRSAPVMHLTLEAFRRAFFDRAEFLGDPDFSNIPVAQLIDKRYGAAWRESIDPKHASVSKDLIRPAIFSQLEQYAAGHLPPGPVAEPDHTTHYSVVDPEGNAVAVTTTLNDSFGSRVTAEGLGFLLNDEMDDFAAKQGVPNMFGLIQGPANAIGPGKRPLSAMAPTIVLKGGKLFLVLGSPGGPRIITTVANILMGVVDYGMNIQEAVNAPRLHHQWLPDVARVEQGFSPDAIKRLEEMGHRIDAQDHWSDGECIMIDPKRGERLGASDQRNNGRAMGF